GDVQEGRPPATRARAQSSTLANRRVPGGHREADLQWGLAGGGAEPTQRHWARHRCDGWRHGGTFIFPRPDAGRRYRHGRVVRDMGRRRRDDDWV
ncbi:unnamed protein product, partial [Urochloa humidicola]